MKLSRKHLFRKYEGVLFHSDSSKGDRIYGFYLLMRPLLGWAKRHLLELGLLAEEAESELFIMCEKLFSGYDKYKSSLIPYLEKQLPWQISKMFSRVDKYTCTEEEPNGLLALEDVYELDEEFYWSTPNILFEDRYIGKFFTRSEKYVISIVLTADESDLSAKGLARLCGIDRRTMKEMLEGIQEVLLTGGIQ